MKMARVPSGLLQDLVPIAGPRRRSALALSRDAGLAAVPDGLLWFAEDAFVAQVFRKTGAHFFRI
jgi:hypothetical protein